MKRMKQKLLICCLTLLCGCASAPRWKRQEFAFSVPDEPPASNTGTNVLSLDRVSISQLFQGRSFTYRTSENGYAQDPYAGFLIPPERSLAESIRAWFRAGGGFGRVVAPGSGLAPTLVAEVTVGELYGDFRKPSQPVGTISLHCVIYEITDGAPGRFVLDKTCARSTPLTRKTPAALMTAWDTDLREIMEEINSNYAKTR